MFEINEQELLIETAVGLLSDDPRDWSDNPEYTRAICELVALLGNFPTRGDAWLALARWAYEGAPLPYELPDFLA